jgi:hypothetical protein
VEQLLDLPRAKQEEVLALMAHDGGAPTTLESVLRDVEETISQIKN